MLTHHLSLVRPGRIALALVSLLFCFLLSEGRVQGDRPEAEASAEPGSPAEIAGSDELVPAWPTLETDVERQTREALATARVTLQMPAETPFEQAMQIWRERSRLAVHVNWPALGRVGVDRTTAVSGTDLRDVSAEAALDILLGDVSTRDVEVCYAIRDRVVWVAPKDTLDRETVLRVYDVHAIIGRPGPEDLAVELGRLRNQPTTRPWGMGGVPGRWDELGLPPPSDAMIEMARACDEFEQIRAEDLRELITVAVSPGSWEPDGTVGSISYFDGTLTINATARTHERVWRLLISMRQAMLAREHYESPGSASGGAMRGAAGSPRPSTRPEDVTR